MKTEDGPLLGLRVIELAGLFSSASLCGRLLADLGADVVMFESEDRLDDRTQGISAGPGRDCYDFEFVASGKRSMLFDATGASESRELLYDILCSADVLLVDREGLRDLSSLKISKDTLAREMPSLIVCCISPFGLSGPLADVPATEITLQALAGPMLANGYREDPPVRAGIPIARCGGAVLGSLAIAAALFERVNSGLGQFIDLSQYDALLTLQGTLLPTYFITGKPFARIGNRHAMAAPWNAFRTADGWIVICTMGKSQWTALAKLIGHSELVDDPRFIDAEMRVKNISELDLHIESWTKSVTSKEATALLDQLGIPVGPILRIDEVLDNPHVKFRRLVKKEGDRIGPGSPLRLGEPKSTGLLPVPKLGTTKVPWEQGSKSEWAAFSNSYAAGKTQETNEGKGPLDGIRVVEVGSFTAGPLAGRLLGMLGAEVVKIEPPKGEGSRQLAQRIGDTGYLYLINNTDKFGCTLALDTKEGRQQFLDIAKSSDVLITNLSTALTDEYKINFNEISNINPELIYCSVTGYGQLGPHGGRKAFDTVIQATSGIMTLTGFPEHAPLKVAMSVADVLGGCLGAAGAVVGLLNRIRTGRGELFDASMEDIAVWATQESWPELFGNKGIPSRSGNRDSRGAPNDCYRTMDRNVVISIENDSQWQALLVAMGRSDLLQNSLFDSPADRMMHADEIDEIVLGWTSQLMASDVVSKCWSVGIPAGIPLELGEVANAQQTLEREMILTQNHPKYGPLKVIGSPFKFSRSLSAVKQIAPDLGQHNSKYLGNLGR